jgi:FLVCR family feline leukemia virus subgroup C receptor-related protein
VLHYDNFHRLLQGAEEDAGRIGLTIVLAGTIGSLIGGIILDRTHWFK